MIDLTRKLFGVKFGFSHDLVQVGGNPYLERWIVWLGIGTLRVHKFWRGDSDRHMHDHPWSFITFPLSPYYEWVDAGSKIVYREVRAFRPHYRPAEFRHIVDDPAGPIYTIVITGPKKRRWGFWVNGKFVDYHDYESLGLS
jgi:hypothetical protein